MGSDGMFWFEIGDDQRRTRFTSLHPVLFPHVNFKSNNRLTDFLFIDDVIPFTSLCSIIVW